MELDRALGGVRLEVWCGIANLHGHGVSSDELPAVPTLSGGDRGCQTRPMLGQFALVSAALLVSAPTPCPDCYKPRATTSPWQIQFQGAVDTSVPAFFFDIDGSEPARTVRTLKRKRRKVACYVNAGAWENFRADKNEYPPELLGKEYVGFPEERWVDIRRIDLLAPILLARVDACRDKGFDGVDPDNLDGFQNDTGFRLSADDQLRFNTWLANEVHARGMSIGLKNDGDQARTLVPYFDWVIVEECIEQRNCGAYAPFTRAGKPIFAIEYRRPTRRACAEARRRRMSVVFKTPALGARRRTCSDVQG